MNTAANQISSQRQAGEVFTIAEFNQQGALVVHFFTFDSQGEMKRVNLKDLRVKA